TYLARRSSSPVARLSFRTHHQSPKTPRRRGSRGETQTPRALEFRPPQSLRRLAWTQRLLHSVVYAMLQRYWRKPIVTIVGFDPLAHNALPTGISCSV